MEAVLPRQMSRESDGGPLRLVAAKVPLEPIAPVGDRPTSFEEKEAAVTSLLEKKWTGCPEIGLVCGLLSC